MTIDTTRSKHLRVRLASVALVFAVAAGAFSPFQGPSSNAVQAGAFAQEEATPDGETDQPNTDSPVVATATPSALSEADAAARVAPSVVQVVTSNTSGSGVQIASGIITNEHVIHGADRVEIISSQGVRVDALVVRADPVYDLALLQTNLPLPPAEMEQASQQAQGTPVLLLGYPLSDVLGGQSTLTRGVISATRQTPDGVTYVQTDASMNPGNSGGALLNLNGKVIGIAVGKLKDAEGINFGIASESVQAFLTEPLPQTPLPTQTTPVPAYNTRNGPKTIDQIHQELASAGYQGPWDTDSMLVAYNRAYVAPTPTPLPTVSPTQAQCQATAAAMPGLLQAVQDAAKASARNDYQGLRNLAAQVRSRTYPTMMLPTVNAFARALDWSAGAAEIGANWPLLILEAGKVPNGTVFLAVAQADMNRDQGEAQAALIDFQTALSGLRATCGS
jgi:hypothetical protein